MADFNIFRFIARQWKIILAITLVVFVAAFASYKSKPVDVNASVSVTIVPNRTYPTQSSLILQNDPTHDSDLLISTATSWMTDPSYVQEILQAAKVTPADGSLAGLSKVFKVVISGNSSLNYQIQYVATNAEEAQAISAAISRVMNANADEYNSKEGSGLKFSFYTATPVITSETSSLPLTPIAGLLAGLVFGLVIAAFADRKNS